MVIILVMLQVVIKQRRNLVKENVIKPRRNLVKEKSKEALYIKI